MLNGFSFFVFVCLIVKCNIVILSSVILNLKIFFYFIIWIGLMFDFFRIYFLRINCVVVKICVLVIIKMLMIIFNVLFFIFVVECVDVVCFLFGWIVFVRLMMVILVMILIRESYWKRWRCWWRKIILNNFIKRINVFLVIW